MLTKILAFTSAAEAGTGVALLVVPVVVIELLLGMEATGVGVLLARSFGIALIALGLACWPGRQRAGSGAPAVRAMLTYNTLVALYLAYLGTLHAGGLLLWPAVVLHVAVALLLARGWYNERRAIATRI